MVGQFVELPALVAYRRYGHGGVRLPSAHVLQAAGNVDVFVFYRGVAFVRAFLGGSRVACSPVYLEVADVVLSVESEVHGLLPLQSCVLGVVGSGLGFHRYLLHILVKVLVLHAEPVLPVVAAVVYSLERYLVERVELIVEGQRIALPFARHVVLARLDFFQHHAVVVGVILKFGVVGASRCVLV